MRVKKTLILLLLPLLLSCNCSNNNKIDSKEINITDFIEDGDITLAVHKALKECRQSGISKIVFPKDTYLFTRESATEKYVFVSNNDEGLKRFVFDLSGIDNLEIDGGGSTFIFDGFLCPFLLINSSNISFKNFSVDYTRTFHSEGLIKAVGKNTMDVSFGAEFPYIIERDELVFVDKKGVRYPWDNLLEFDSKKQETAYRVYDFYIKKSPIVEQLKSGDVRIHLEGISGTPGNVMVFDADHRLIPIFTIHESSGIKISDIIMNHAGGMGVIAQMSRDIEVERVTTTPSKGRMISLTADATHFSNCGGKIILRDCLFEKQMDDATNIHGIYACIEKIEQPNKLTVRLVHRQQYGLDIFHPNTKIEISDKATLMEYHSNEVETVERLNKEYTLITLKDKLPENIALKDVVAQSSEHPDVVIEGCTIRNNRARGILLGSRGPILIKDNYFHTPGSSILLEGDAKAWFEQSGVRDLTTITGNVFDNCNYGVWGSAVIRIGAGIDANRRADSKYNQNIKIEGNTFRIFTPQILDLYSVDEITYRNNKIEHTKDYPSYNTSAEPFNVKFSTNVNIEP